jgi:hypothetical protein
LLVANDEVEARAQRDGAATRIVANGGHGKNFTYA